MLTHRLWYSIIARLRYGRPIPNIYKHECVRTIKVRVGGKKKKRGKTPVSLVEVRTILFSDREQAPRAQQICFSTVENLYRRALDYINTMIDFAEFVTQAKYDFSDYALLKLSYLESLRAETRLMRKDEYSRPVTLEFFRNWMRIITRLQSRLYGIRPPLIPDIVNLILFWDPESLELERVCIEMYIIEPETRHIIPLDCSTSTLWTTYVYYEWGIRLGEPDPPIPWDNYFTIDFDCFDYDDLEEINECMWKYRKTVSYLEYAKWRGDVAKYLVFETERGYHIIVYANTLVPVYKVRLILGDDEDRLKMDATRYFVSGIHDTLFTNKQWCNLDSPPKPPKRNEWYKGDDISKVI